MNACMPTDRSFCINKKPEFKPRSPEASERMNFFMTHEIKVITDPEKRTARMEVTKK